MSDDVPEQFRPRLCHVVKWSDFSGYGFNLHAEKGKAGQFIGKVDEHSPAEAAGLKEGDRIVEVNGINIGNENHQQVVARIKSGGEETRLLVVDNQSDNWYKEQKRVVKGDAPEVKFISSKRENHSDSRASLHDEAPGTPQSANEHISFTATKYEHNGHSENDSSHRPRLCHLKLWPHFQGYGFNLHAERDKPGQFIGLVDDDSPASTGGLKVNDRIVEVNGVNIEKETHTEVIARIKAVPGETKLLVVDRNTDNYYKEKGLTVSSSMPQTEVIITPNAPVPKNGVQIKPAHVPEPEPEYTVAAKESPQDSPRNSLLKEHQVNTPAPTTHTHTHISHTTGPDGLELNLSVAEIKERLKAKKKQDPRMNKISFEQKYKEFQRM